MAPQSWLEVSGGTHRFAVGLASADADRWVVTFHSACREAAAMSCCTGKEGRDEGGGTAGEEIYGLEKVVYRIVDICSRTGVSIVVGKSDSIAE